MQEAANTKVVQEAYAAFARGDVAAILERIDDNVVWNGVYGTNASVPRPGCSGAVEEDPRRSPSIVGGTSSRQSSACPTISACSRTVRATRRSPSGNQRQNSSTVASGSAPTANA